MYGIAYGFLAPRCCDGYDSEDAYSSASSGSSSNRKSGMSQGTKDKLRSAGSSLQSAGDSERSSAASIASSIRPVQYHKGGKVRKTGPAVLKRGERVIPASKRKKAEKVMRKAGMSLTNKKHGKKRKGGGRSSGR